jgi:hypothetical protein
MDGEGHHTDGRRRTDDQSNAMCAEHELPPKTEL